MSDPSHRAREVAAPAIPGDVVSHFMGTDLVRHCVCLDVGCRRTYAADVG